MVPVYIFEQLGMFPNNENCDLNDVMELRALALSKENCSKPVSYIKADNGFPVYPWQLSVEVGMDGWEYKPDSTFDGISQTSSSLAFLFAECLIFGIGGLTYSYEETQNWLTVAGEYDYKRYQPIKIFLSLTERFTGKKPRTAEKKSAFGASYLHTKLDLEALFQCGSEDPELYQMWIDAKSAIFAIADDTSKLPILSWQHELNKLEDDSEEIFPQLGIIEDYENFPGRQRLAGLLCSCAYLQLLHDQSRDSAEEAATLLHNAYNLTDEDKLKQAIRFSLKNVIEYGSSKGLYPIEPFENLNNKIAKGNSAPASSNKKAVSADDGLSIEELEKAGKVIQVNSVEEMLRIVNETEKKKASAPSLGYIPLDEFHTDDCKSIKDGIAVCTGIEGKVYTLEQTIHGLENEVNGLRDVDMDMNMPTKPAHHSKIYYFFSGIGEFFGNIWSFIEELFSDSFFEALLGLIAMVTLIPFVAGCIISAIAEAGLGYEFSTLSAMKTVLMIELAVVIIGVVICFIVSVVSEMTREKSEMAQYENSLASYEKKVEQTKAENAVIAQRRKTLRRSITQASEIMQNVQNNLQKIYDNINIPMKYRNLTAVSMFMEYFECDRVDTIREAINLYEQELRMNAIIVKLDDVLNSIDRLQETQSILHREILSANHASDMMIRDLTTKIENSNDIAEQILNTSQLNAFNTSLLVYSNDMILKTLNTHS